MKLLSFRKVTQGTALALFLAAFYAAVLLLGWPPLRIEFPSSPSTAVADDALASQDGGALRRKGAGAPSKLVFLKSAPGFHEKPSRAPTKLQNGLEYSDQASGEDLGGEGSANNNSNNYNNNSNANNGSALVERSSGERTRLEDVFLSVKTTRTFHRSRLDAILKTWFVLAREQTYFFSDFSDPLYQIKTNGHLVNTNCSATHNRKALCCKMSVELDFFLDSNKKWMCHFDDDNYVNVPRLVRLLQGYDPREDWYLGKPSIRQPLEILARDSGSPPQKKISFWFATGGAGFCISRSLALKMLPIAGGGKFISIGEHIRLPDDVTMGYIVEHLLKKKLTVVENFHSHLEPMKFLKKEALSDQVTFSYSRFGKEMNVLSIDGFPYRVDPTRFLSLHCHLFPNFSFCPR
uniref:Putative fringe glycosyltransferase n=1 Tax=Ixodes ricinus TaxID=34613 RepID=A0A131XRV5_IXORI